MTGTLVDSNVILDVLTEDADWFDWSSSMLAEAARAGHLYVNPIDLRGGGGSIRTRRAGR